MSSPDHAAERGVSGRRGCVVPKRHPGDAAVCAASCWQERIGKGHCPAEPLSDAESDVPRKPTVEEATGEVQLTVTATKGEPCPTCGAPQNMLLRINLGEQPAGGDVVLPFDHYLCEACCPPILHPPLDGLTLGERLSRP